MKPHFLLFLNFTQELLLFLLLLLLIIILLLHLLLRLLLLPVQPYMRFALLHHLIPGFSSLTSLIQFLSLSFFKSFITSSLHLVFDLPLVLIPMGYQSVNFLTSFVFSILFTCPHHFILCAVIFLTSSPLINFQNSLLLPILHPFT